MKLGKITDANEGMNPLHFGNDPADIRIRISAEMQIQIRIAFGLVEEAKVQSIKCTWYWQRYALSLSQCSSVVFSLWSNKLCVCIVIVL